MNSLAKSTWIKIILLISSVATIIIIFYILEYFDLIIFTSNIQQFQVQIIVYLVLFAVSAFFIFNIKSNQRWTEIGFNKENLLKNIGIGIFSSSGFLIGSIIFLKILVPNYDLFESLILLALCLLVGLTEESIFRGYIYHSLNNHYKLSTSVFITAFLFALLHIPRMLFTLGAVGLLGLISFTLLGIVFGYYRKFLKSIIGVILLHALWDYWMLLFVPENLDIFSLPDLELINLLSFLLVSMVLAFGLLILNLFLSKKLVSQNETDYIEFKRILGNEIDRLENDSYFNKHFFRFWKDLKKYLEFKIKRIYEGLLQKMTIDNFYSIKKEFNLETKILTLTYYYYTTNHPLLKLKFERKIRYYEQELGVFGREKFDFIAQ